MGIVEDSWRQSYHLMPPNGWMNDPNGLCCMNGVYHVFFQYTPDNPLGGNKYWGQYTSTDLLNWEYEGIAISPDQSYDKDGVYSGCAFCENQVMHIFYTGNAKEEGNFDYVVEGRSAVTVHGVCKDGKNIVDKQIVLKMEDYPKEYSCHIRDPKVWKEEDGYYMVLGSRTLADEGRILLYHGTDFMTWQFVRHFQTSETFGYMWECPDMFQIKDTYYLSISPQGVEREEYQLQNVHQSGYFQLQDDFRVTKDLKDFFQWDYGFDFYAPQTFCDEKGRRILIGWMGLPDMETEYENPTVGRGWQHCLTMLREIKQSAKGQLLQYPVAEYKNLRKEIKIIQSEIEYKEKPCFEMEFLNEKNESFSIAIEKELFLTYNSKEEVFEMNFKGQLGAGRSCRKMKLEQCNSIELFIDHSSIELYLNKGEKVMSSRFYPSEEVTIILEAKQAFATMWTFE